MRKLIPYLRGYEKESIIGPLFKLLEACLELLVPIIMASAIDKGIGGRDSGYILTMGGLLVLMGALGLACSLTAQYFAAKAAYGFGTALRRDMFDRICRFSFSQLDQLGTATLITRITGDINQAQSGVNLVLRLFLRSPFIVAGALIMAFTINTGIALIFLAAVPILALIIYTIMAVCIPMYRRVQKGLDSIALMIRENLTGVRIIRAFARQGQERRRSVEGNRQLRQAQLRVGRISALMNPLTYVVVNLAIILLLWQGGIRVDNGIITQGQMIALVNYMTQILLALVALAQLIITFTRALASAVRINEVMDVQPQMDDTTGKDTTEVPESPRVAFENVFFSYEKSSEAALENITLSAEAGQTIGIIGGTGSGKSTLVNLIPRFYDVIGGSVRVDGVDVRDMPLTQLRDKIGVVPQKAVLFQGTLRENMQWGKKDATDDEIRQALEVAQAWTFVADKPGGLDARVEQGGRNFSGGQRQRLTIARALVGNPKILILDDSASALDFATEAALRRALAQNAQDRTVFMVSQRAAALRHADKIAVLDDGALVGLGTHEQLLDSCQIYQEICASQLSEKEVHRS